MGYSYTYTQRERARALAQTVKCERHTVKCDRAQSMRRVNK